MARPILKTISNLATSSTNRNSDDIIGLEKWYSFILQDLILVDLYIYDLCAGVLKQKIQCYPYMIISVTDFSTLLDKKNLCWNMLPSICMKSKIQFVRSCNHKKCWNWRCFHLPQIWLIKQRIFWNCEWNFTDQLYTKFFFIFHSQRQRKETISHMYGVNNFLTLSEYNTK